MSRIPNRLKTMAAVTAMWLVGTSAAYAQSAESSRLSIGAFGGAASVQNVGGLGGLELGYEASPRLTLFGEGAWVQDAVTRRRLGTAESIAGYLRATQGRDASGTVDAPTWAFTGGARVLLHTAAAVRPYLAVQGGVARITLRPAFALAGADVTTSLEQYGVTLGEDITGHVTKPAFGGGFGILTDRGTWTVDVGLRFLSIQTDDQATNVARVSFGLSRRF
jgi:hypothetical protein